MIVNDRPLSVLADLMDATEVTDDLVTGVLGLAGGRLGGREPDDDSWLTRRMGRVSARFGFGTAAVARGLADQYGPVQLRKATAEAARLVTILDGAREIPELQSLVGRLDELDVPALPGQLRRADPTGPTLTAIHQRLSHARAAMIDARTRIVLGRRRRT